MSFGNNLKDRLHRLGYRQSDLAEAIGVSTRAVSTWVNGHHMPTFDKLCDICEALECSEDDLLEGGEYDG